MRKLNLRLGGWVRLDFLQLASRLALAAIFLQSGRTKVEGWMSISPSTVDLFATEYQLPWVSAELAAHLATYAEHLFPLLLALGLFSRGAALGLLGMTAVIQVFVYPLAWPTHLSWAVLAMIVIRYGPGPWSMDRTLRMDV